MTWGIPIVLTVIGIGLTLWEIATRPSPQAPTAPPGPIPPDVDVMRAAPVDKAKAWAECNLAPNDLKDTDVWAQKFFSASMPFIKRVALMKSVMPVATWPDYARRADCYLTKTKAYG